VRVGLEPNGLTRLHDRMAEGTMVHYTVGPLYETLARASADDPERLEPLLASSWVESEDHLSLSVTLKAGVLFHDGALLTSADVKATLDAVLAPTNATATLRSTLDDLESVTVQDEQVFTVKWRRPYFLGKRNLLLGLPVMPAKHLVGDFDTLPIHHAPVGTGPFTLERWQPGVSLTLARNPRYHGPQPGVDRVVLRFVGDDVVAAQLWEQGLFDVMTRVPPATWLATEHEPWSAGYVRTRHLDNLYYWLGWNERLPIFQDRRVRRALALLYPADVVARVVDLGLEERTTCPYYRSRTACDPTVTPLPFDARQANALLDQAGWLQGKDGLRRREGQPLSFTVLTTATSVKFGKLLPLYQDQLRTAGIELKIERIDAAAYMARMRAHDFDVATLSWSSPDDVVDAFQLFHSSQVASGSNYVGYANPEVDRRLEQIRLAFDPGARAVLEREVHRLLFDDQVYLFLTHRVQLDAVKTRVRSAPWRAGWYDLAGFELNPP
jgi:peptide/nickel transport system substrate-binding protein